MYYKFQKVEVQEERFPLIDQKLYGNFPVSFFVCKYVNIKKEND